MSLIASQITSLVMIYSAVYSDADQRKHKNPASLVFVRGIHRGQVNSPHKWPVTRNMFPFDDVIMGFFIYGNIPTKTVHSTCTPNISVSHAYLCVCSISHWGHWWRPLQPTSSIITDAKSVDSNPVDFDRKTCLDQPWILHNNSS